MHRSGVITACFNYTMYPTSLSILKGGGETPSLCVHLVGEPRARMLLVPLDRCDRPQVEPPGDDKVRQRQQAPPHEEMPAHRASLGQSLEHLTLNKRRRTCIPEAVLDGRVKLVHAQREHAEEHHQADASLQAPEGHPHETWGPMLFVHQMLHAEEDAAQCNVPLHAKHSAMGMVAGEVGGMVVVIDNGKIDQRAQEARAGHIPKIDAKEEEPDLPHNVLLLALPNPLLGELRHLHMLPSIQREQDEREDLRRGEDTPKCDHTRRLRDPIEIVADTDHCSEEEEKNIDVRGTLGLEMTLHKRNPHGRTKTIEEATPANVWITTPIMERTKNLKQAR